MVSTAEIVFRRVCLLVDERCSIEGVFVIWLDGDRDVLHTAPRAMCT